MIILGTVQLGTAYGINNRSGKPDTKAATALVDAAWEGGVRMFDTAQAYGDSESVLGSAFRALGIGETAQVISKLPPDLSENDAGRLEGMIVASLEKLGCSSLYCLMFHREEHMALLNGNTAQALQSTLETGKVRLFGVSTYTPEAALDALRHPLVSVVQIPASIMDRRFESAGVFDFARAVGKQVHIRSAFLQGVLCMHPGEIPEYLAALRPFVAMFQAVCESKSLKPTALALAWLMDRYPEAHAIFGAETVAQVRENLDFLKQAGTIAPALRAALETVLPPQEASLLNPALWGKS